MLIAEGEQVEEQPVAVERAGVTMRLLWRERLEPRPQDRPRRSGLTVDAVIDAAVSLASEDGLQSLTMRRVAERLGVSAMTPYSYVPGKDELLELMLDAVYGRMAVSPAGAQGWRGNAIAVAEDNLALHRAHPWTLDVEAGRPTLGPGVLAKYDRELAAFDGIGLTDVEMDAALANLLALVREAARTEAGTAATSRRTGTSDAAWWEGVAPLLAEVVDAHAFPLASRVGSATGEALGTAYSATHMLSFGLDRLLDGIAALIDRRAG